MAGPSPVAAIASVDLVSPDQLTSLVLVGNTVLAEGSPADLQAVVTNNSDVAETLVLSASAGREQVSPSKQAFTLGPRQSKVKPLTG